MEPGEKSPPRDLRARNTTVTRSFPGLLGLARTASITFTDHRGQRGVSAYWGRGPSPGAPILPPLWSLRFYVTFGATTDSSLDLPKQLLTASTRLVLDRYPICLDVSFLPSVNLQRGMEHYRTKKAAWQKVGERLLVIDSFSESGVNFSFLVMITKSNWESVGGTTVVSYDNNPDEPKKVLMSRSLQ